MIKRAVVSILLVLCPSALFGQTATGQIIGTVTDPSGAVIGAASIAVTNTNTNTRLETTTDSRGTYQVPNLPIGSYTVGVKKQGFATTVTTPTDLQINQTLRIDVGLTVNAASQTVTVEAQAAQVETVNPTIGATVTGE